MTLPPAAIVTAGAAGAGIVLAMGWASDEVRVMLWAVLVAYAGGLASWAVAWCADRTPWDLDQHDH